MNIYHITSRADWIDATRNGSYTAPSLKKEGFIHCSSASQVVPVANQFYRGQHGLVLLVIDTARLGSELKWERSAPPPGVEETASFPHVYGSIDLDAVVAALDFEPNRSGRFALPKIPMGNA